MKWKWLIATVLVLLASVALYFVFGDSGRGTPDPRENTVPLVRRDMGSTVLATGIIKPMVGAEVKVGSRISGVVKKLNAKIGDIVAEGQLLAELDDAELLARLKQNQAALTKARSDFDYADQSLRRQRSLFSQELISPQELDTAVSGYQVAKAQLKQAEANLDYAQVQLGYSRIFSPIEGTIASVSTQEGETVSASLSSPTFVTIIDLNRLEVQAYVDETDIGKIRVGQEALFTVDSYGDTDIRGRVTAIYPKAVIQDNVVNYIVTLEIQDRQGAILRPEMTANVTLFLELRKNVLAVPANTVIREGGERFVTVLQQDQPVRRKVKTGWKDDGMLEIISGVEENERIVLPVSSREEQR